MTTLTYSQDEAIKSDSSFITDSGYYKGTIQKVFLVQGNEQSKFCEIIFESDSGDSCTLRIYTTKKDGCECFGRGKILALMGLLNLNSIDTVPTNEAKKETIPDFFKKKIGITMQSEEYEKNDGGIGIRMNLLHFHDYQTNKTLSETLNKKEANIYKKEIKDKVLKQNGVSAKQAEEDLGTNDLPF